MSTNDSIKEKVKKKKVSANCKVSPVKKTLETKIITKLLPTIYTIYIYIYIYIQRRIEVKGRTVARKLRKSSQNNRDK